MRAVLLASLRSHLRRYVAVGLAVGIGVAFVVVTGAITNAARDGLSAAAGAPYEGAEVVASGVGPRRLGSVLDAADAAGAQVTVLGGAQVAVEPEGGLADEQQVGLLPGIVPDGATHPRWPALIDGTWPGADGEALVDTRTPGLTDVAVGDRLTLSDRDGQGRQDPGSTTPVVVRVVGTVDGGTTTAAVPVYVGLRDLAPFRSEVYAETVAWAGPGDLAGLVPATTVVPARAYVDERVVEANRGVDVLAVMLLLFASVALFVAVLVIGNTFAVLLAQRRRELALLRCVGATRAQLRRAVRLEALVVGGVATAVGLGAGTGLGHAVVAVVRHRFPATGLGDASAGWAWYAGAAAVGVVVTVVAAWLPTRRATRVAPVAALGPDDETSLRTGAGRVRLGAGGVLVALGAVALTATVLVDLLPAALSVLVDQRLPLMLAGGVLAFSGLLLLGPVVVPGLIRAAGAVAARAPGAPGAVTRIAAANAVRDPRRTSAATASLLVGVTLTTAVLVGLASARSVTEDETTAQNPFDATVSAGTSGPGLPAGAAARIADVPGVERAVAVPGVVARVGDQDVVLVAPDAADGADAVTLTPGITTDVADGEVLVPGAVFPDARRFDRPTRVAVPGSPGPLDLTLRPGDGLETFGLVSEATLARLAPDAGPAAVWVTAADGVAGEDLAAGLTPVVAAIGRGDDAAELTTGLADRDYVEAQFTVVTAAVVGLLGIAVVIALVGIANTLGLSVLERTRELALLRALGLTRARLRGVLAAEGVMLALVATLLGTAVGVVFAWVGLQVIIAPVVAATPLVVPWGQLGLVLAAAVVAGLLAAVLPARRAARVAPAAGLTVE